MLVGDSEILFAARKELIVGLGGLLGRGSRTAQNPSGASIVVGNIDDLKSRFPLLETSSSISVDGYWLARQRVVERLRRPHELGVNARRHADAVLRRVDRLDRVTE